MENKGEKKKVTKSIERKHEVKEEGDHIVVTKLSVTRIPKQSLKFSTQALSQDTKIRSNVGYGFDIFTASNLTTPLYNQEESNWETRVDLYPPNQPYLVPKCYNFTSPQGDKVRYECISRSSGKEIQNAWSVSFGVDASYEGFTAGLETEYGQKFSDSSKDSYCEQSVYNRKLHISMAPVEKTGLDPLFLKRAEGLKGVSYEQGKDKWKSFFTTFGTHFVVSTTWGGNMSHRVTIHETAHMDAQDISLCVKAGFEMSGFGLTTKQGFKKSVKNSRFHNSLHRVVKCSGGDETIVTVDNLDTATIQKWLESFNTIQNNMVDVDRKLQPISGLFGFDGDLQKQMFDALNGYCKDTGKPLSDNVMNAFPSFLSLSIDFRELTISWFDDSGSGVELYGNITIEFIANGRTVSSKKIWDVSSGTLDVEEGTYTQIKGIQGSESYNHAVGGANDTLGFRITSTIKESDGFGNADDFVPTHPVEHTFNINSHNDGDYELVMYGADVNGHWKFHVNFQPMTMTQYYNSLPDEN